MPEVLPEQAGGDEGFVEQVLLLCKHMSARCARFRCPALPVVTSSVCVCVCVRACVRSCVRALARGMRAQGWKDWRRWRASAKSWWRALARHLRVDCPARPCLPPVPLPTWLI